MKRLSALCLLLPLAMGCFDLPPFHCASTEQCGTALEGATCEPENRAEDASPTNRGLCSYVDASCPSGHRYEQYADPHAGACVSCGRADEYCCNSAPHCEAGNECTTASVCSCITALRASGLQSCALTGANEVWCWGIDVATRQPLLAPLKQASLDGAQLLALGEASACAQRADGSTVCIGDKLPAAVSAVPAGLELAIGYVRASAAEPNKSTGSICVRKADGSVWCVDPGATTAVQRLTNVVQLSGSEVNFCAVKSDGSVWCWGLNYNGQLGMTGPSQDAPVQVPGVTDAVQVATGHFHACARRRDGTVYCWGQNAVLGHLIDYLGTGINADAAPPAPVIGMQGAVDLAVGQHQTCAFVQDGSLYCWGAQAGEVSGVTPRAVRVAIAHPERVALGANGCVQEGTHIWCWGAANIGDGNTEGRSLPTRTLFTCPATP